MIVFEYILVHVHVTTHPVLKSFPGEQRFSARMVQYCSFLKIYFYLK
jgi:hypothetical protein